MTLVISNQRLRLSFRFFGRVAVEAARVVSVIPRAENIRMTLGPEPAAAEMRRIGRIERARSARELAQLERIIRVVERFFFVDPNCYRRALVELALDSGAASKPLMLGFRSAGGPGSGHAWLGPATTQDRYDAVVSV
jgi:hypothetical protein